jgi:hypothetical protein
LVLKSFNLSHIANHFVQAKSCLSLIAESFENDWRSAIEQLKFDLEKWVVWLIAATAFRNTKIRPLEFCVDSTSLPFESVYYFP